MKTTPVNSSVPPRHAPPVLLIVFNRVEVTRRMIDSLRRARPAVLYVAADGPRPDRPDDERLCAETRRLVEGVDWPCEIRTLYRDSNLGLVRSLVGALDWFFEEVESGVILEDDCLPAPGFFPFAGDLLERYAEDPRILHISGLNMRPEETFSSDSYFFAGVGHVWGWATWRRAWRLFDPDLMPDPEDPEGRDGPASPPLRRALDRKFRSARAGRKWQWTRAWYHTTVRHHGLAVIPAVNFVRNIGDGDDATHRHGRRHPMRLDGVGDLGWPLRHPSQVVPSKAYERHLTRYHRGTYARQLSELRWAVLDRLFPPAHDPRHPLDGREPRARRS